MNKYKALLYKDLIASKKMIIMALVIGIYLLLIGYLFRYSLVYGNNKNIVETEEAIKSSDVISMMLMFFANFATVFIAYNISIETIFIDRENKYFKFLFISDIDTKTYVKFKIIESLIVFLVGALISSFINFIYLLQFFTKTNIHMFIVFALLSLLETIIPLFTIPFAIYLSKSKRIFMFIFLDLLLIVLGIIGFLCVKDGNMQNLMNFISKVNSKFSLYASLAFVLILVLEVIGTFFCYFASIKVMEKRERLCLE